MTCNGQRISGELLYELQPGMCGLRLIADLSSESMRLEDLAMSRSGMQEGCLYQS